MDSAIMIFYQIVRMFFMMAVGWVLARRRTLDEQTTARLSDILLMVATPCTLITSFHQPFSSEKLSGLIISFGLSVAAYLIAIVSARLLFRSHKRIEHFSVVFSNAGFLGIPLVSGVFGAQAVFYLAPFIACFYLFAWTYGVVVISDDRRQIRLKKILTNPCILSLFLCILVFLMPVKPWAPLMEAISSLGSLNTPLAMLVLGAYMAKGRLLDMFRDRRVYYVSFCRLIVVPLLIVLLFALVPDRFNEIRSIILIGAAAPVGVLAPIFAQMFGLDSRYGAQIVSVSTIFSLFTMPLILLLSQWLW